MRDIDYQLQEWRKAFLENALYSDSDILELESHLLEAFDRGVAQGADPDVAFKQAVKRVGSESSVRPTFDAERSTERIWVRWIRSYAPERRGFSSEVARHAYTALRVYSICFGIFAAFWAAAVLLSIYRSPVVHGLNPEAYFYVQGPWLHLSIALLSVFNLLAFVSRPGRTETLYRGILIAWVLFILAFDLSQVVRVATWGSPFDAFFWDFNLAIGPVVWLITRVKKPTTTQVHQSIILNQSNQQVSV
ncbi:MAG: hypothetical protein RIE53_02030 [Rhodothermales bacterium]